MLYGHDFLILYLNHLIDLFNILIGHLLDLLFSILVLVLSNLGSLFHLLKSIVCIAADVANRNLRCLALLLYLLGKLFSALLSQFREYKTDTGTVIGWIDSKVRRLDRLLNRL